MLATCAVMQPPLAEMLDQQALHRVPDFLLPLFLDPWKSWMVRSWEESLPFSSGSFPAAKWISHLTSISRSCKGQWAWVCETLPRDLKVVLLITRWLCFCFCFFCVLSSLTLQGSLENWTEFLEHACISGFSFFFLYMKCLDKKWKGRAWRPLLGELFTTPSFLPLPPFFLQFLVCVKYESRC